MKYPIPTLTRFFKSEKKKFSTLSWNFNLAKTNKCCHYHLQKADSGDSGNEEPEVAQDFCDHSHLPTTSAHVRASQFSHKMDKLAERIGMLTLPRERDHVPEGLVDSLPPEGSLFIMFSYGLYMFISILCQQSKFQ